jgi:hypothetical protein
MARVDDIYKELLDYIQKDNDYKIDRVREHAYIVSKLESIEGQAKMTNGRVTKLEADVVLIQQKGKTDVIVKQINWKWIVTITGVVWFLFTAGLNLFLDIIKERLK